MAARKCHILVVGCGIGGLASAVSALESGADVTILERAPFDERGGQTRYTEAYFRMKSETEVSDDFEMHLAANSSGYIDPLLVNETAADPDTWPRVARGLSLTDPDFISTLATEAGPTVTWLKRFRIRFDFLPTQFLTKSQPRLLPVGGGLALVEGLAAEAERQGAKFLYETTATSLVLDDSGRVAGVVASTQGGPARIISADAVVLACGGFEGNAEMMTRYVGPRSVYLRPICRGGYFNKGEGVRMALEIGAAPNGDFGSYHAEPIDPRSGVSEPSVFIFPYGILVNRSGHRFTDEAPGTVDAYYERVTRQIYAQDGGIAFAVLDAKHMDIPNYRLGIRTDKPPIVADTIEELAGRIDVPPAGLRLTVEAYNSACRPGSYDPLKLDGRATEGLDPKKSHWALPLDRAPYHAYPIISANVFTFGGLKVDRYARVLNLDGYPIAGLYAAGEIIGTYYGNYTGATSVLKGATFGRIGGQHAVATSAQDKRPAD
ncbi:FAD-dependent oxidoreductase [Bradyrhizobium sp. LHD-71]|uniref:FAD-dependent oxidoreductase n=1 Tax=Bradyrhizobium sp. LHD-71 TaxID=3072141 RepID=UPI00280D0A18|nr:FAD-dependent oxidoreductase [Bradyrhizobium sp. LHD-71]MDQ8729201.1 FAD-dependent oxidoreductase [Bradyrhizobium sp. LHD-71]